MGKFRGDKLVEACLPCWRPRRSAALLYIGFNRFASFQTTQRLTYVLLCAPVPNFYLRMLSHRAEFSDQKCGIFWIGCRGFPAKFGVEVVKSDQNDRHMARFAWR